jgi:D-glycero-D-manno-heptose 1,7-bisphosphate phosphatase
MPKEITRGQTGSATSESGRHAAVFLDRDGTINEEVGYLDDLAKLRLIPSSFAAIRMINESGMKAVVITNQSGVARGLFPEEMVREAHRIIQERLARRGARIDGFYYCPHHPTEGKGENLVLCRCRKPAVGLVLQAAQELDIDIEKSYLVGDTARDMETARNAGVTGILVRTGMEGQDKASEQLHAHAAPAYTAEDILDAVRWIMKDRKA